MDAAFLTNGFNGRALELLTAWNSQLHQPEHAKLSVDYFKQRYEEVIGAVPRLESVNTVSEAEYCALTSTYG
jgi:hypothetical protein